MFDPGTTRAHETFLRTSREISKRGSQSFKEPDEPHPKVAYLPQVSLSLKSRPLRYQRCQVIVPAFKPTAICSPTLAADRDLLNSNFRPQWKRHVRTC
ncbi:hypothetical protein CEXT_779911 [Caerostris extrusa]|uniref:Uncharacterized protein n=1 Tax=Caerostris extrusa TaxID=172846 RepID=A0AAV4VKV8_CAEEX|nr:hypothetical protein CEXT_779911 [Caerostris extrusa]